MTIKLWGQNANAIDFRHSVTINAIVSQPSMRMTPVSHRPQATGFVTSRRMRRALCAGSRPRATYPLACSRRRGRCARQKLLGYCTRLRLTQVKKRRHCRIPVGACCDHRRVSDAPAPLGTLDVARPAIRAAGQVVDALRDRVRMLVESRPARLSFTRVGENVWRIDAEVDNDPALRDAANDALRSAVFAVRDCFDGVAREADAAVRLLVPASGRPRLTAMPRFRTLAKFAALRATGVFDGWRPDQVRLLEQFQPLDTALDDSDFTDVRDALRRFAALLNAYTGAPDPHVLALWVQPEGVSGDAIVDAVLRPAGMIRARRTLGELQLPPGVSLAQARPRTGVLLGVVADVNPAPNCGDDGVVSTLRLCLIAAESMLEGLERSIDLNPLSRERAASISFAPDANHDTEQVWAPMQLDDPADQRIAIEAIAWSDIGVATLVSPDGERAMIVRTPSGPFTRPLPHASLLDPAKKHGAAVEDATIAAAATWGLPDFVLRPKIVAKGNSVRELNDSTIVCGPRALAIQSKARDGQPKHDGDTGWLTKNFGKGARQAAGTVRTLKRAPQTLLNGRGRAIELDANNYEWIGVVVLDHPTVPDGFTLPNPGLALPIVPILRRDWDFLFDQLRSVTAVVDYLHRVADCEPVALGQEPSRYFELAEADERSIADRDDDPAPPPFGQRVSTPLLPKQPAAAGDAQAHAMYRVILEDIALTHFAQRETDRVTVLGMLDRLEVSGRAELGRLLLQRLRAAFDTAPDVNRFEHRIYVQDSGRLQLFFSVASQFTEVHREIHTGWSLVRRRDFIDAHGLGPDDTVWTVAVLLTPRWDGHRLWDTTMLATCAHELLDDAEYTRLRKLWAAPELQTDATNLTPDSSMPDRPVSWR
jgi:hypothetical protein